MKTKIPPSSDIVAALVSIGFIAGEETPITTVLSDGTYTVNVPKIQTTTKDASELKDKLDEIFSYYALEVSELTEDMDSERFDETLKRVAFWASEINGGH
ncbi:hypothetical protein GX441_06120 [bacterium]|nr:hypothetical protein [bacterium]